MKDKHEIDQLLVSYLLKELDAEQKAFVTYKIKTSPDWKRSYEEMKSLSRLLKIKQNIDGINILKERDHLEEKWKARQQGIFFNEDQLQALKEEKKPAKLYKYLRLVAVAASIVMIAGAGWRMLHSKSEPSVAIVKKEMPENQKSISRYEKNFTGHVRQILLQDGSQIGLDNQSSVSFLEPFAGNKREIRLSGKAGFKVAKDKTKPFIVYSGDIATTALGTEFMVTNFEKTQIISVRLLEGKVVITSSEGAKKKLKRAVYLLPGQELIYNKINATAQVRKFVNENDKAKGVTKEILHDNPSVPKNYKGSWYMFNNQSLPEVLDELERMFGVEIRYKKDEIQKLYFIGKFDKSDSLEYILRNIATINNLKLLKEKNQFIIRK